MAISFFIHKASSRQEGQILLIVILAMVVALTVGLSVVSRTVTSLKTSKQNEESQKAFQAAEAGIDQALKNNPSSPFSLSFQNINNSQVSVTILGNNQQPSLLVNNGDMINQDEGFDVWTSTYPDYTTPFSGTLNFYWDENDSNNCGTTSSYDPKISPALEVLVVTDKTNPTIDKYVYDPCSSGPDPRPIDNSRPVSVGSTINGKKYRYRAQISGLSNVLFVKVIPLYNSTTMSITATSNSLSQGKIYESTGKSGDSVHRLDYFVSYPQIPSELMQYAIISQ